MTAVGALAPQSLFANRILAAMAARGCFVTCGIAPDRDRRSQRIGKRPSGAEGRSVRGPAIQKYPLFYAHLSEIAALSASRGLASIGPLERPAAGGLIGYGVDFKAIFRRAA